MICTAIIILKMYNQNKSILMSVKTKVTEIPENKRTNTAYLKETDSFMASSQSMKFRLETLIYSSLIANFE